MLDDAIFPYFHDRGRILPLVVRSLFVLTQVLTSKVG